MSYTISFKVSGDFLKAELTGSYPMEKFRDISSKIDTVIDANGISKILVDLRNFSGRFGVFDGLNHIEKFRDEVKFLNFAIVDDAKNKHDNDFFENASHNRGYRLLFFYDESEALKWLQVEGYAEPEKLITKEY